jgi:glycosyltransferase involved in cell wall biosynthesis
MALGLPAVCTDAGGNHEVVLDGVTGLVVPPGDPEALVRALGSLRTHADVRKRMGEAGRARVEREYSVGAMVRSMTAVYEETIARCGPLERRSS